MALAEQGAGTQAVLVELGRTVKLSCLGTLLNAVCALTAGAIRIRNGVTGSKIGFELISRTEGVLATGIKKKKEKEKRKGGGEKGGGQQKKKKKKKS